MPARRLPLLKALALTVAFGLSAATLAAPTDPLQDAGKLIKQGQYPQALEQVDRYLSDKPKDAQGRFLRGVILTEMGRTSDAINVFTRLTDDYPELPEPYNNLAVIYAQQKQYEKAKQALEMAIRTHPAYATAHENLGDIYARMASQAYDKALQLDSSNAAAQTKLSMIRDLISTSNRGIAARPAPVAVAAAPAIPVVPVAPTRPIEPVKPAVDVKPVTPAALPAAPAAPVAVAPAPAKPAVEPAKPAAPKADASDDIAKTVAAWAAAWSHKDVKAYLAHYGKEFKAPGGDSRSEWEAERTRRIKKPGNIKVEVEGLKVSLEGNDRATARFRQHYSSATLNTSSGKVLELVKRDNRWLIVQERVGG